MAGPVDLTALGHQEETLLVFQQLDALFHVIGQLPLAVGSVHGVVHRLAVGEVLGDDEGLARPGRQRRRARLCGDNVVARLCGDLVVVGAGAVAVHFLELAARKVFEAGIGQLYADLVVVLAGVLVGVEGGRGGVVDVDGGYHADLIAFLLVQLLGDGLVRHIAGPRAHVDDAALGLIAGGDGGRGGRGVRAEGCAVVGGHAADFGEGGEAQLPLGDGPVVLGGALIEAGRLDLGSAHAVADEQENVLRFLQKIQQTVLFFRSADGIRLGCAGRHRGSTQQTGSRCRSTDLQEIAAGDLVLFHTEILSFGAPLGPSFMLLSERFYCTELPRRPKPWRGKACVKASRRRRRNCKERISLVKLKPPNH